MCCRVDDFKSKHLQLPLYKGLFNQILLSPSRYHPNCPFHLLLSRQYLGVLDLGVAHSSSSLDITVTTLSIVLHCPHHHSPTKIFHPQPSHCSVVASASKPFRHHDSPTPTSFGDTSESTTPRHEPRYKIIASFITTVLLREHWPRGQSLVQVVGAEILSPTSPAANAGRQSAAWPAGTSSKCPIPASYSLGCQDSGKDPSGQRSVSLLAGTYAMAHGCAPPDAQSCVFPTV